jgi:hypothetical protein
MNHYRRRSRATRRRLPAATPRPSRAQPTAAAILTQEAVQAGWIDASSFQGSWVHSECSGVQGHSHSLFTPRPTGLYTAFLTGRQ